MKSILLTIVIIISVTANAQITKIYLKASGLTCSMCSNAINKALKTLDFVDKVKADISTYTFEISFKANEKIDFDKIRNKVEGAGFSVSGFIAIINFDNVVVKKQEPLIIDDKKIILLNTEDILLNGLKEIKILNKGFIQAKEYRRNHITEPAPGIFYATI